MDSRKPMIFAAIDFETANDSKTSACSIGMAIVREGVLAHTESRLIRPPTDRFSPRHVQIHGITWARVKDEPDFSRVWETLAPRVAEADFLVAHYSGFDSSVLKACCKHYGTAMPAIPFACSCKAAKAMWPLPSHSLDFVSSFLGIRLRHHEAGSDAEASARIMLAAIRQGYVPRLPQPGTGRV